MPIHQILVPSTTTGLLTFRVKGSVHTCLHTSRPHFTREFRKVGSVSTRPEPYASFPKRNVVLQYTKGSDAFD